MVVLRASAGDAVRAEPFDAIEIQVSELDDQARGGCGALTRNGSPSQNITLTGRSPTVNPAFPR